MCPKYNNIEQTIVDTFIKLINDGFTAKDAVLTLDYWIFIKFVELFEQLDEEQQMEVRKVIHSLKLVHV